MKKINQSTFIGLNQEVRIYGQSGKEKTNGVLLAMQAVIVVLGTFASLIGLYLGIASFSEDSHLLIHTVLNFILFLSIIVYCVTGFKRKQEYFLGVIYAFTAAQLFRLVDPAVSPLETLLIAFSFGLMLVFGQRLDSPRVAHALAIATICLCFASALYATLTTQIFMPTIVTQIVVYAAY